MFMFPRKLEVGDRVRLYGGYLDKPKWLNGRDYYLGTVEKFIPGQNDQPAVVVDLEEEITCDEGNGRILILELRYEGAKWKASETVHLELCDFEPEEKPWKDRRQGKWIESHASYKIID